MVNGNEVLCTICSSPLLLHACWPSIGAHKDCLDGELQKVGIVTAPFTPHEKVLEEAKTK